MNIKSVIELCPELQLEKPKLSFTKKGGNDAYQQHVCRPARKTKCVIRDQAIQRQ